MYLFEPGTQASGGKQTKFLGRRGISIGPDNSINTCNLRYCHVIFAHICCRWNTCVYGSFCVDPGRCQSACV